MRWENELSNRIAFITAGDRHFLISEWPSAKEKPQAPFEIATDPAGFDTAVAGVQRKPIALVFGVQEPGQSQLLAVAQTADALGLLFGFAQGWQKHAGQDGDDRYHHQQFDQGESRGWIRKDITRALPAGLRVLIHREDHGRPGANFEMISDRGVVDS